MKAVVHALGALSRSYGSLSIFDCLPSFSMFNVRASNVIFSNRHHQDLADLTINTEAGMAQGNHHVYVNDKIGGGSFGEVFKGTYVGRDVAVKFVQGAVDGRPMFQQEVSIWGSLHHHNIAKFIGSTCDMSHIIFRGPRPRNVNVCCMVSEYYPRGSVPACYLRGHQILSRDVIRSIALDVARGLSYLHDKCGIIHGDVKPSNLLVDSNGTVKIADFGKSHWAARYDPSQVGGDIQYLAPEVIGSRASSTKADVYSFGITLWVICHNRRPYPRMTPHQISQAVFLQNARPHISGDCPKRFVSLMTRCWHANPGNRPSMDAVVNELNSMRMLPG